MRTTVRVVLPARFDEKDKNVILSIAFIFFDCRIFTLFIRIARDVCVPLTLYGIRVQYHNYD
jgi:hypothetical protein